MASVKYADRPVLFEVSKNSSINLHHILSIEQPEWTDGQSGKTKQKTLITMDNGSTHLFDGLCDEVVSLISGRQFNHDEVPE